MFSLHNQFAPNTNNLAEVNHPSCEVRRHVLRETGRLWTYGSYTRFSEIETIVFFKIDPYVPKSEEHRCQEVPPSTLHLWIDFCSQLRPPNPGFSNPRHSHNTLLQQKIFEAALKPSGNSRAAKANGMNIWIQESASASDFQWSWRRVWTKHRQHITEPAQTHASSIDSKLKTQNC